MVKILLSLLGAVLLGCLAYGSKCPEQDSITRHVLCYYEGRTPLNNINLCNCTHIILTNAVRVTNNYTVDLIEDVRKSLDVIKDRKPSLIRIFTLNGNGKIDSNTFESTNKSRQLTNGIAEFIRESEFNGVELNLPFAIQDPVGRDSISSFVKVLKKTLENSSHLRVKRGGYFVSENLEDDITTAPYRTPTARSVRSNEKQETNKRSNSKRRKNYRGSRYNRREQEEVVESRTEKRSKRKRKELRENHGYEPSALLLVRLPTNPEVIAKKFDLKVLSKYADLLTVSTNNITDDSESKYTYHPSRLMGLSDMLNADSILDFLTGLGVEKSKIVLTLPATILKFKLEDAKKTTPRSVRIGEPEIIDQSQLCSLFSKGNWTVERDDDLTAPYAFSDKTWLAYEDRISVNIKAKYILLRELAGGAIYPIDADNGKDPCNDTSAELGFLTNTLYKNVMTLERKPRDLVLESLQQDIHNTHYSAVEAGVHLSEYRIVRVVDHTGAVHVIRKNTKTQFECSRQGYFSHPLGCNKFYRCVKFNQYTDDFTVFEYDCPAGLAFDERWEVCVWPGSLPHGAPCTGSSEIAPVPRSHYQCPNQEGYYADPENCRWFFACLDHARDGVTPLTAYEFRCPFGLVFNEQKLVCDWPWNVGVCGNRGFSGVIHEHHGGSSAYLQSATYGAYGSGQGGAAGSGFAHSGQYSEHQGSFGASAGNAHSGSAFSGQSVLGYIAGHFEDNQDRASFGTVPEYEISGGRILNRGGLILNHNVNLQGIASAGGVSNANGLSSSFESGRSNAYNAGHVSGSTGSPAVHTVQTVTPSPALPALKLVYNPPLSSPRPFTVNIPDVQVNQEQHSVDVAYVGGSTTSGPETVAYVSGAKSGGSGNLNTFTFSSESGEYVRDDTGFGDKISAGIAAGHGFGSVKNVGIAVGQNLHNVKNVGVAAGQGFHTVQNIGIAAGQNLHDVKNVGVATGQGFHAVQDAGVHVTTPRPIHQVEVQGVQTITSGYDGVSQVSGTTAGYDSGAIAVGKTISVSPELYQVSNAHFSVEGGRNAAAYSISSSTPTPEINVHNSGVSEATVLVTPKPDLHTYKLSGDLHQTSGLSAVNVASAGVFRASNGSDSYIHRPAIEVTNVGQNYYQESGASGARYSANSAGSGFEHSQSGGNAVLLEEHVERVVVPKVVSSPAPTLSYEQPSVNVKSAVFSSTPKPTFFAAVTPATQVTVERQNFIGPITISSPAPTVFTGTDYRQSLPAKFVESVVSTPSPAVYNGQSYNFGGRFNSRVNLVKPAIHQVQTPVVEELKVVSSPAPAVFKGPEYLPPVESAVAVQQNVKQFVRPSKFTSSTPVPAIFRNSEYTAGVEQGRIDAGVSVQQVNHLVSGKADSGLSVVQQNLQTYQQVPVVETKFVSSTPSSADFGKSGYVAVTGLQGQSELKSVQQNVETYSQRPVVEQVEIVQPVVSTPAPAVFKRPQYFGFGTSQRHSEVRSRGRTYTQVPAVESVKFVQPVVSKPAPAAVFSRPQYFGFRTSNGNAEVKSSVQQNIQTYSQGPVVEEIQVVQPVVSSTPAPAVFNQQEYVAVGGLKDQKSSVQSVQQNVHTYSQGPVVEEIQVVQPVVSSTPAPAVFNRQEYVAVGGLKGQKSSVQQNVHSFSQGPVVEEIQVVQPVVSSTPAPAVFNRQEYVAVGGLKGQKSSVQQNVHTYSQGPVVEEIQVVQPVVSSTPAPAVFNRQEYVAVGGLKGQKSSVQSVQQNIQTYSQGPVVEEIQVVQPVVSSTPAPAVFNRQEYVAVGGVKSQKSSVQQNVHSFSQGPVVEEIQVVQPVVSTPAPAVVKEEYYSPIKSNVVIQQNGNRYRPSIQTQFVSTPAPTVFSKDEYVSNGGAGGYVNVLKSVSQNAQTAYKGPEYLPPVLEQNVELKSIGQGNLQTYSQPQIVQEVKYAQPVVSSPSPSAAPVGSNYVQSTVLENTKVRQHFLKAPIRGQTYNFVPSTTVTPVIYEQKQETVSFSPINVQQEIYRSRPKSKQLFSNVVQPQVSITYQQPQLQGVVYSKSTPAPFTLKTPSPTPAQVFGYHSANQLSDVGLSSPKPTLYIEEVKSVNAVDQSTPRPYVYEEYIEVSSPKPTQSVVGFDESAVRVQQPIVVTGKSTFVQPKIQQKEAKTVYYEDSERGNPVLTVLEKEIVQPVVQQETYTVSSESPVVVNNVQQIVDYVSPTGEEVENYRNFDIQKVGKSKAGVLVQTGGIQSGTYETGNGQYKVNSNIHIAPPSEEYILSVTPKIVTTTVAPTTAAPIETSTVYRARARPATSTVKYTLENDYDTDYRGNEGGKATIFTVGQVDREELDDDNVESLLQKYSGDFGNVLGREKFVTKVVQGEDRGQFALGNQEEASTIGYEVSTSRSKTRGRYKSTYKAEEQTSEDSTVASLDLKNLKIKKNKKTVIIVSQVSDANPLLIGKLAGQCSCQSNKLQIRKKVRVNGRTTTSSTTYSPVEDEVTSENVLDSLAIEAVTPKSSTENIILIDGSRTAGKAPLRKTFASRRNRPSGRSRTGYDDVVGNEVSQALFSPVPADEIAATSDYSANQIGSHVTAGASFDRYGPGGLRGFDETLQGTVNCERPGLFRHPKYCNKFYACNYDPWKKRYTLHVFNCPIHLSYDSSISACNWPSKGPACSDDHLLI